MNRRQFLGGIGAGTLCAPLHSNALAIAAELSAHEGTPEEVARDESYWARVQEAFTVDRSVINFNNGGVSPAPAVVQEALARHLAVANQAPAYNMWRIQEPRRETVRAQLARHMGVDAEEIAITRNASEGLQTCQLGFDLKPGDEVLTTDRDYPRMLTTFRQRERREGIVLRQFPLPGPEAKPGEIARLFEQHITDRTRLILMCHVVNLTGHVMPVKEVVALARKRDIPVIVDGAHAFAHFPFQHADLDCDYYATSLHKWLFAPIGTGMLYVRRAKIAGLWPLMAAKEAQADDIRKFEEIGTHPVPLRLAIADALRFHEGIGPARKTARLVYLRDRWARRLAQHDRVRLLTSLEPGRAFGIATVGIDGIQSNLLAAHLVRAQRIITSPIQHPEVNGVRVSPSVYSSLEEVDLFTDAMLEVAREGLPG